MTHRARFLIFSCALSAFLWAGIGAAQDGQVDPQTKARAEALFAEGASLLDAGNAREACPKLEAAVELTKGEALGGKLVLARCYEAVGKKASAWGLYNEVAARAGKSGQVDRAAEARDAAEKLGPKLHRVVIVVPPALAELRGLKVELDGREITKAAWSSALPIDAGDTRIVVSAPDRESFESTLTIPNDDQTTRVEIPVLRKTATRPPGPDGPLGPGKDVVATRGFWSAERIAGLVLGVTGLAAVGVGSALGAVAKSDYGDGLETGNCSGDPPVCDDTDGIDGARALGDAATGVFFAGLGTLAVGVVVFATAPRAAPSVPAPPPPAARLFFGPRSVAFAMEWH